MIRKPGARLKAPVEILNVQMEDLKQLIDRAEVLQQEYETFRHVVAEAVCPFEVGQYIINTDGHSYAGCHVVKRVLPGSQAFNKQFVRATDHCRIIIAPLKKDGSESAKRYDISGYLIKDFRAMTSEEIQAINATA